jgi:hypothetical protein
MMMMMMETSTVHPWFASLNCVANKTELGSETDGLFTKTNRRKKKVILSFANDLFSALKGQKGMFGQQVKLFSKRSSSEC